MPSTSEPLVATSTKGGLSSSFASRVASPRAGQKLQGSLSACSHEGTRKRAPHSPCFPGWLAPEVCLGSTARQSLRVVGHAARLKGVPTQRNSTELFHSSQRPQQLGKALLLPSATHGMFAARKETLLKQPRSWTATLESKLARRSGPPQVLASNSRERSAVLFASATSGWGSMRLALAKEHTAAASEASRSELCCSRNPQSLKQRYGKLQGLQGKAGPQACQLSELVPEGEPRRRLCNKALNLSSASVSALRVFNSHVATLQAKVEDVTGQKNVRA